MDLLEGTVLIKITAPWCKACQDVKDIESFLKEDFPEVKFVECNYDNNKDFIISKIPYFILYKNREKVDELQTSVPTEVYKLISKNMMEF